MNIFAIAVGTTLVFGGLVGAFAWEELQSAGGHQVSCPVSPAIAYTPEERADHGGRYRVRLANGAQQLIEAEVCIFDAAGVMRHRQVEVVQPGAELVVEITTPIGSFNHVDRGQVVEGIGGGGGVGGKDLRWCFSHAAEHRATVHANGYSGRGGECVPNRPLNDESHAGLGPLGDGDLPPDLVWGVVTAGVGIVLLAHWPSVRWFALGLFTRLQRPRILEHRIRAEIRELVAQDPGVQASAIAAKLDLADGQLRHHLGVLVREEVLTRIECGGTVHFFLRGSLPHSQMRIMSALRNPSLERLLALVRGNPGLTIGELAQRMDQGHSNVSKLAKELAALGLVSANREGRRVRLAALS